MKRARFQPPERPAGRSLTHATLLKLMPFAVLLVAFGFYFREILLGRNYLWEDILYQYYPFTWYLLENLHSFRIPLWNPFMFAGMPFAADVQTQVFYPLNWLIAAFFAPSQRFVFWLVEFKCVLHLFMGAVFCYLLLRDLGKSRIAGVVSGFAFGLSGFMIGHIIHMTLVSAYSWFPLVMLFYLRTLRDRHPRDAVLTGLVLGAAALAGHPQVLLHMLSTIVVTCILFVATGWRGENRRILSLHVPLLLLSIVIGLGCAAAAYWPAFVYSGHTVRELMTFQESSGLSLPLSFPILLVAPKFFGSVTGAGTDTVPFWGAATNYDYWETACYIGIIPLILAVIGLAGDNSRFRWPLAIIAGLALVAALGRFTPLYRLLFEFAPGFDRFRIPARFVGIFTLSASILAGFGVDALFDRTTSSRSGTPFRLMLGITSALLGGWLLFAAGAFRGTGRFPSNPEAYANSTRQMGVLAGFLVAAVLVVGLEAIFRSGKTRSRIPRWWAPALLALLTFADLYVFGHAFSLGTVGPEQFYPGGVAVRSLLEPPGGELFRINARKDRQMVLQRNEGLLWKLELLEGYTPLKLADYVGMDIPQERKNDLLNVRYRIAVDEQTGRMGLAENPTRLPRATVFRRYRIEPDRGRTLDLLRDPEFDFRGTLLLEKDPELPVQVEKDSAGDSVRVTRRTPEELRIDVKAGSAGVLLVSEVFYPEWRATIDGRPADIMRADYCLRAVSIPAGAHQVVMRFSPRSVIAGGLTSLLTLLLALASLIIFRKHPGRTARQRPPTQPRPGPSQNRK